jgi:hypothetical protein
MDHGWAVVGLPDCLSCSRPASGSDVRIFGQVSALLMMISLSDWAVFAIRHDQAQMGTAWFPQIESG